MRDRPRPNLFFFLILAGALCGSGCEMERRVTHSTWDQWKQWEWYDASASSEDTRGSNGQANRGYAIELARFEGDGRQAKIYRTITDARQKAGLANLWYTETGVYAGRFRNDDSSEAKAMLRQVRSAEINDDTPFEDALIVRLTGARSQVNDPLDLRSLSGRGLYTLQIGYYDTRFGNDYRKAAETAVKVLREQDEEAYYYHGPNRSLILIEAWTYGQAFTRTGQVDRYSNLVRLTQEKHPQNVPNGQPFSEDDDPEYVASQRSFMVPIR